MAISSLGVGSGILTQDVIDQLRKADEAGRIQPIELSIVNENDRKDAFGVMDAHMTNLTDSIEAMSGQLLYNERSSDVLGTSVEVTADENTDIQDFTLNVVSLATKQIEQSGSFALDTTTVATGVGSFDFNVGTQSLNIAYDGTTTLDDLKDLINEQAGDLVDATIVQVSSGDFRLFISSAETGDGQDISIVDGVGGSLSNLLTTDTSLSTAPTNDPETGLPYAAVQSGVNAEFKFNGQTVFRESNDVNDLITGLDITLKEVGISVVSIAQNREGILEKIDNFVKHYNETMTELDKLTKSSTDADERGIFSVDSTIKSMKRDIENMLINISSGAGAMEDYGFEIDKDGKMSIDKTLLEDQLDTNAVNVQSFFAGGTFITNDPNVGDSVELEGAFVQMFTTMDAYAGYNGTLDQFEADITDKISTLEDRKMIATERLDSKYEIMAKQFAAYDSLINKFNAASDVFTQLVAAQSDS
ncbi:flagellar filament capping protein FliD [Sulfurimonas aquatica]|uniref:Flagellar hook-associated protein 2 n=1 Tax=Sulfurimonas aquatica TaxID=2672570 RepID=A0A975GBS0_9BACT|nr:flagellar filament capping protein FliD [Sulfurimonas aquatica]QSZ40747.1 flagellar filament capping protein FliD [Sulfurimonas aquatica]